MLRTLLVVIAVALVASPATWAKNAPGEPEEISIANAPSAGIEAGGAWTAVVRVKPTDLFRQSRVVFPKAGRWTYGLAMDSRFIADTQRLTVAAREDSRRPAAAFAIGGIVALVLLPAARVRRPQASP